MKCSAYLLQPLKNSWIIRAGSIGFFHEGELFITGRLKDLIIIAGRNHHPEDIEQTIEWSHPALQAGCCAAFSIDATGEERLIIAVEIDRRHRAAVREQAATVIQSIRQAVSEHHDLRAHDVLLLKPAGLPKTSNGKIQRHVCRRDFLAGTLKAVEESSVRREL